MASPIAVEVYAGDRLMHEAPFGYRIGTTVVAGNMDLISWSGAEALVVDYKTGGGPTTPESREKWRRQAECYALAVLEAGSSRVRVVFVKLETREGPESFEFTDEDAPRLRAEIVSVLERMSSGEFEPLPAYSPRVCPACPALGSLCPVRVPRSRGGAA